MRQVKELWEYSHAHTSVLFEKFVLTPAVLCLRLKVSVMISMTLVEVLCSIILPLVCSFCTVEAAGFCSSVIVLNFAF